MLLVESRGPISAVNRDGLPPGRNSSQWCRSTIGINTLAEMKIEEIQTAAVLNRMVCEESLEYGCRTPDESLIGDIDCCSIECACGDSEWHGLDNNTVSEHQPTVLASSDGTFAAQ